MFPTPLPSALILLFLCSLQASQIDPLRITNRPSLRPQHGICLFLSWLFCRALMVALKDIPFGGIPPLPARDIYLFSRLPPPFFTHGANTRLKAFSENGALLASVGQDDNHCLAVHDWEKGKLQHTGPTDMRAVTMSSMTIVLTQRDKVKQTKPASQQDRGGNIDNDNYISSLPSPMTLSPSPVTLLPTSRASVKQNISDHFKVNCVAFFNRHRDSHYRGRVFYRWIEKNRSNPTRKGAMKMVVSLELPHYRTNQRDELAHIPNCNMHRATITVKSFFFQL